MSNLRQGTLPHCSSKLPHGSSKLRYRWSKSTFKSSSKSSFKSSSNSTFKSDIYDSDSESYIYKTNNCINCYCAIPRYLSIQDRCSECSKYWEKCSFQNRIWINRQIRNIIWSTLSCLTEEDRLKYYEADPEGQYSILKYGVIIL